MGKRVNANLMGGLQVNEASCSSSGGGEPEGVRQSLRRLGLRLQLGLLAALVLVAASCDQTTSSDALLAATKGKLDSYRQELMAAGQCAAQGDTAGLREHQALAETHLRAATTLFEATNAATSDDLEVLKAYAGALTLSGDSDLEAKVRERAVSLAPEDAAAWAALGKARAHLGPEHREGAEEALRRALEYDSSPTQTAAIHAELAELYRGDGLYDMAREHFAKALEADSEQAAARIGLAGLDVRDGNVHDAVQRVEALGQIPQHHINLLQKVMSESVRDFEAYRRWFPDEAENHLAYAKVLIWANRLSDCVMPLKRAAKLEPDNTVTWNFLGSILRQIGQNDQAREAFEKSLALNPDQPHTRQVLEQLGGGQGQQDPPQSTDGAGEENSASPSEATPRSENDS